jgi:hypothetical protein
MKLVSDTFSHCGWLLISAIITNLLLLGCTEPTASPSVKKPATTTAIGEFAPEAKKEIVDPKVPVTDPITGPLAVLKNAQLQIPQIAIEHALNLFQASEGRFPESHAEFMQRIITENQIRLPQLSADLAYEYDVQNHRLVVVRSVESAPKAP